MTGMTSVITRSGIKYKGENVMSSLLEIMDKIMQ